MAERRVWYVADTSGQVLARFATRAESRAYAREHGIRGSAEYRARVAPKLAAGISLPQARGHPPGGARITPRRRTRHGAVVRKQWTVGAAGLEIDGEARRVTVKEALRRLRAFRRANPGLTVIGTALHGKPYKERKQTTRWTGWLQEADDLEATLVDASADGVEYLADVTGLADRAAWESIDELAFYVPGDAPS